MLNLMNRARWTTIAGSVALCGSALLGGCDVKHELLEPQNPGVIDPAAINSPAAAEAVRVGAFNQLKSIKNRSESFWMYGGLLTDEWKSSDTFSQRNETDQRSVQTNNANVQGAYTTLQQSRGFIRTAIDVLNLYAKDSTRDIGQMYMAAGFSELTIAENLCNGVPETYTKNGIYEYGPQLSTDSIYKRAAFFLDSAVSYSKGTDAASVSQRQASLVIRARVLVEQGKFAEAAALVPAGTVPTNFQYLLTFDQTTGDNQNWSLNISQGRYTVSDSFDASGVIKNAIPFASLNDPRVPVTNTKKVGFDGTTTLYAQGVYAQRSDPVPLASGIDARLIEAEAKLNANDIPGMMTILNALRTSAQTIGNLKVAAMSSLATPADKNAAISLLFREKALWTFGRGQRLPDDRRQVRLYGRTQDQVFPTGAFHKGGVYGADVNFPVTDNEKTNPNFAGCTDRKA
jgi:hypothetical protein